MSVTTALCFKTLVVVGLRYSSSHMFIFLLDCANHHDILTELSACDEQSLVLCSVYFGVTESIVRFDQTGTRD